MQMLFKITGSNKKHINMVDYTYISILIIFTLFKMIKQITTISYFFLYSLFPPAFAFWNINMHIIKLLPKRHIQKKYFVPELPLLKIYDIKNK